MQALTFPLRLNNWSPLSGVISLSLNFLFDVLSQAEKGSTAH